MPFSPVVTGLAASNQVLRGVRVLSKTVPAAHATAGIVVPGGGPVRDAAFERAEQRDPFSEDVRIGFA
jgi:hypothetical protein